MKNGKMIPKGKRSARNLGKRPTKSPVKGPFRARLLGSQTQAINALKSSSGTTTQTTPSIHLVVVLSPSGTSSMPRKVVSPRDQPAEIPNPYSLATVMKEMKDYALANGTVGPSLDEIEAKYQQCLALHFVSGLFLPPFLIAFTSPVVTQAMNSGMGQQQVELVGHLSGGTTNVASSHSGSLSATGLVAHEDYSQSVPNQSASSCQTGQFEAQTTMVNMQTDNNLEQAHMAAVENQLQLSNADPQNMKCMMQNMAESMQAKQSVMMSQTSANVVASALVEKKKPKKQSQ